MSRSRKSQPDPEPPNLISARLEHVRVHVLRLPSKRAFWQNLVEGWEEPVSYSAAKNYHYDREPPVSYLKRVSEVFGVRLPWLLSGSGFPTEAAERANRAGPALSSAEVARSNLFAERVSFYEVLDPLVQFQIAGITRILLDHPPEHDVTDDQLVATAETVVELLLAPFLALHGRRPSRLSMMSDQFTAYAVTALAAIVTVARTNLLSLDLGSFVDFGLETVSRRRTGGADGGSTSSAVRQDDNDTVESDA